MVDKKPTNYFYIGTFVLVGLSLIIATIIIFGSKAFLKDVMYTETYFNESVQGLSDGSPVKYLGMEIGHVVDITTVDSVYDISKDDKAQKEGRYIYVKMALEPRFFNAKSPEDLRNRLQEDVKNGLRIKLALQGLTGNAYLELDFVDPKTATSLPIYWQPECCYIPSVPSALTYFSDNAQYLIGELRKIDIKALFVSIKQLIKVTRQTAANTDKLLSTTNRQVMGIVTNLQIISQNMKLISERAKADPSSILFGKPPPKMNLNKL